MEMERKSYYGEPIGTHQRSFERYQKTVPFPTPYGLRLPKIGVRNPHQKLKSLLSQERVKLWTSTLAKTITGSIRKKPVKNFGEKGVWAYPGSAQFFGVPLLSEEREKLHISNLASAFTGSIWTNDH